MYWIGDQQKEELRRNTLSIRFTDAEHRLVCDAAWRNRVSASGMIREILLSGLKERGLTVNSGQSRGAVDGSAKNEQRKQRRQHKQRKPCETAEQEGG